MNLYYVSMTVGQLMVPVKNGFDPLDKFAPLHGVIIVHCTWTSTNNVLEKVVHRANLFLVMHCIFMVRSSIDLEEADLLIIVLALATSEIYRFQFFTPLSQPSKFMFT